MIYYLLAFARNIRLWFAANHHKYYIDEASFNSFLRKLFDRDNQPPQ